MAQPGRGGMAGVQGGEVKGLPPIKRLQTNYNKRLENELNKMIDSYGHIIRTAKMSERDKKNDKVEASKDKRDNLQLDVLIENLVLSAESLSQLVYEIKQTYVLCDSTTLCKELIDNTRTIVLQRTATEQRLEELSREVDVALNELEMEHYSSLQNSFAATGISPSWT